MAFTSETKKEIGYWIIASVFVMAIVLLGLLYYPELDPQDPYALHRVLALRIPMIAIGVVVLVGSLIFADVCTTGDWLVRIGENPISASILCSAIVLALAWIWSYS